MGASVMVKHRKAYHEIEKVLNEDNYSIIILTGLRKTGKTTILKQLSVKYKGYFLDIRASKDPLQDYYDIFSRQEELIFLDEVGYLPEFDSLFNTLEVNIKRANKKVVLTSSAYGVLRQISHEVLGGGRSFRVELFPLSFEEYLYFSGKIENYGDDCVLLDQDLQNFYRMRDLPEGMGFFIDRQYMLDNFNDAEVARANQGYAIRSIGLTQDQYIGILDVIAYTLNYHLNSRRFGSTHIGEQEFEKEIKGIDLSSSLIGKSNKVSESLDFSDITYILVYLLTNGFLFVDLLATRRGLQDIDYVLSDLRAVRSESDLDNILRRYSFSVVSPLVYTRLLCDLEDVVGRLCSNRHLYGELYELSIKSESIYARYQEFGYKSYKYHELELEKTFSIDLYVPGKWDKIGLLLEATLGTKRGREHSVNKVFKDKDLVRMLTDICGKWEFNGELYRIGYPQALLLVSNSKIYNLNTTKIGEPETV